jgi:hypothetical protein
MIYSEPKIIPRDAHKDYWTIVYRNFLLYGGLVDDASLYVEAVDNVIKCLDEILAPYHENNISPSNEEDIANFYFNTLFSCMQCDSSIIKEKSLKHAKYTTSAFATRFNKREGDCNE